MAGRKKKKKPAQPERTASDDPGVEAMYQAARQLVGLVVNLLAAVARLVVALVQWAFGRRPPGRGH